MSAVIEFGFNAAPVFSGVSKMDALLQSSDAKQRQRGQRMQADGRMQLALIEAQISGNKREAQSIQNRISMMERMRTIQQQTNVSMREAYALAQRSAGVAAAGGKGGRGSNIGMAAMQMQDIAVQMQMGTRMSTIIAQQGSQMLSIFGPGGMILGGVVAVAGAFYAMGENAKRAFKEAEDGQQRFNEAAKRAIETGSLSDQLAMIEQAGARAKGSREAYSEQIWKERSAGDVVSEWAGGPSFNDKYNQKMGHYDQTQALAQKELSEAAMKTSAKERDIVIARLQGRMAEAEQMERQLRTARELAGIDRLTNITPEAKKQLKSDIQAKATAEQAAADKTVADQKKAEMDQIAAAQTRLDDQKKSAALDQMTLAQRIAVLSVDAQKALAEENRLKNATNRDEMAIIDAEGRRVAIQAQILSSQKQLANEKKREADEAKRAAEAAAEAAKQAAAAASTRRGAVMDTALEFKMLEAKAAGRKKEVEEIEKQQRVLDRARRLEEQNGMSKRDALGMAIKMTDMEDRANGKRRKIRGVQGVDPDPMGRYGLSGRPSGPLVTGDRTLSQHAVMSKNSGLNGFWNHQLGNIGQMGTNTSGYANQNAFSASPALQATHQANAAAASAPGGGGPTVDVFLEKLISRLPPALAAAILSQT